MTRTLTLKNRFQGNSTIIENDFIDHYMAKANGEYVKVYLLLLRHLNDDEMNLSISGLADFLECTEKDILRAFTHWSKEGLLKIDYDEAGNICGLAIGKAVSSASVDTKPLQPATAKKSSKASAEELRQLYFVAEQYLGKPLSVAEIKKINYFYDTLHFSSDLIEYLIAYCVESGHRTFRYIESVALSWSDAGIKSIDEAKMQSSYYNKNCYSILNAFGIKGRSPAPVEMEYIKKWCEEYGFSLEIILEACNRTISNTHKPDFKYADSILNNWFENDVHSLSDITLLDVAHREKKTTRRRGQGSPAAKNTFNNFEGRSYDMTSLEQQLLKTH